MEKLKKSHCTKNKYVEDSSSLERHKNSCKYQKFLQNKEYLKKYILIENCENKIFQQLTTYGISTNSKKLRILNDEKLKNVSIAKRNI